MTTEIHEELFKEWRHRFYKLGKDESYAILSYLGYWSQMDGFLDHGILKKILYSIVKDGKFEMFRERIIDAEKRIAERR